MPTQCAMNNGFPKAPPDGTTILRLDTQYLGTFRRFRGCRVAINKLTNSVIRTDAANSLLKTNPCNPTLNKPNPNAHHPPPRNGNQQLRKLLRNRAMPENLSTLIDELDVLHERDVPTVSGLLAKTFQQISPSPGEYACFIFDDQNADDVGHATPEATALWA